MAKILVCDDSAFMRGKIMNVLKEQGHQIVGEAGDGDEAIEKFKQLAPDLVTMDIFMKPDGVDAISRIKKVNPLAKIVIISILAGNQGEIIKAISLGSQGYLPKPIKSEMLVNEVNRVLSLED